MFPKPEQRCFVNDWGISLEIQRFPLTWIIFIALINFQVNNSWYLITCSDHHQNYWFNNIWSLIMENEGGEWFFLSLTSIYSLLPCKSQEEPIILRVFNIPSFFLVETRKMFRILKYLYSWCSKNTINFIQSPVHSWLGNFLRVCGNHSFPSLGSMAWFS